MATPPTNLAGLDSDVCVRAKKLQRQRGWVRRFLWHIWQWFFIGPRAEIAHEVQLVQAFAERAKERILEKQTPSQLDRSNLVDVLALLECARKETDFANAWSYVNLADAILPLIVTQDELPACLSRLAAADVRLPDEYREELKKHLSVDDAVPLLKEAEAWLIKQAPQPPDPAYSDLQARVKKVTGEIDVPSRAFQQNDRYAEQLVRTVLWNGVNRKISLKLALWASIRNRLVFALLALFTAIALWIYQHQQPECPWDKLASFVEIGLLGLFGGMLSAFLKARDEEVNVPSYEVVRSRTSLRMLLGAAGALVMYGVGLRLLSETLQELIRTDLFAFMSVGIVAGFSERLLIDTLEKAASNLHTSGSPTQDESKSKDPSSDTAHKRGLRPKPDANTTKPKTEPPKTPAT